jgi:predicted ribosome quality control (RQC) complex YloA/Tae2 family protein
MNGGVTLGFCWEPTSLAAGLCAWRWPRGTPEEILTRHGQGARVEGVRAVPGEPILRLELSGHAARALVWEAIGRSANAFLLGEGDLILWSGRLLKGPLRTGRTGEPWTPPPGRPARADAGAVLADAVADFLDEGPERLMGGLLSRGRRAALARLDHRAKALRRKLESLESDRTEGASWAALEPLAQSLLTSGNLGRRGESERRVWDYTRDPPEEVMVPLDPAKSVRENAEDLFRKIHRGKARMAATREHAEAAQRELDDLPEQRAGIESCTQLTALFPEGRRATRAAPPQVRRTLPPGVATVPLPGGFTGYAGKSAEGNDTVTFSLGRGGDFWFHAEDYAGCHVVVRCPRGMDALPYDVEQAAALYAAAHSGAPPGNRLSVSMSRCKYLRRVKGSPGRVMMGSHRTLFVDLPRAR